MKPTLKKIRPGSRSGNAMVEFALASLILIPIFIGTFQFGYTFYIYNLLGTQIRAGARYASMRTFNCADSTSIGKFKTAVKNMVMYSNPSPGQSPTAIISGLSLTQIDVEIKAANGTTDADKNNVPVTVTVSTSTGAPFAVDAVFKTFTFSGKPILQFPYMGQYQPAATE
jgi:Flp pilus assembly protein TadG